MGRRSRATLLDCVYGKVRLGGVYEGRWSALSTLFLISVVCIPPSTMDHLSG